LGARYKVAAVSILMAGAVPVAADPAPATAQTAGNVKLGASEPATLAAPRDVSLDEICATLESVAALHDLPLPFFVRLIWQESRFRSDVISRAGAQGIAQFMPGTAEWRGLLDPRDPIQSLHKSADYLRELRKTFGNLGLAAAAYNGGSGRVEAWLSGQGGLPRETRRYVEIVTGFSVDDWRTRNEEEGAETQSMPAQIPCPFAADNDSEAMRRQKTLRLNASLSGERPGHLPAGGWSVQIAANYVMDKAQAQLERLEEKFKSILGGRKAIAVSRPVAGRGRAPMTRVVIVENSKADAVALCARLRAVGAPCVVTRNL
jgi:hypothetical protein